jgi:hypothetical protein
MHGTSNYRKQTIFPIIIIIIISIIINVYDSVASLNSLRFFLHVWHHFSPAPIPSVSMLSYPRLLSTAFYISQYLALTQLPSDCFIAHVTSMSTDLRNPICALTSMLLSLLVRTHLQIQISINTLLIPHKAAT